MQASYLTVDALKLRLKESGIGKVSGSREQLLQRCCDHGLVTDYERLATRSCEETRRAWLVHELERVHCSLRSDSRLCEAYIKNGYGSPREIAGVMAEMKFYHEETRYESIRDEIRRNAEEEHEAELEQHERQFGYADRDFRPRFYDFYCPEDASADAKARALKGWLEEHANGSLEIACEHPAVPPSIQRSLLHRVADERFGRWFKDNIGGSPSMEIALPYLRSESIRLADLTRPNFEAWFGAEIRAHYVVVNARKGIVRAIECALEAKGLRHTDPATDWIRNAAADLVREGLTSERIVAAVKSVVADHIASSIYVKHVTPFAEAAEGSVGRWHCSKCQKSYGSKQGVVDHSRNAHNVLQRTDVEATLVCEKWTVARFTAEALRDLVLQHLRRIGAARTIQAHWRNVISNPEFDMCKRRLMRECTQLGTMF